MKILLTGNEAIARAAYEAGVRFASAYPGTPSTEILENITTYPEITSEWAPNEKVAMEAAVGAAVGGVRAMVSMKHVGMNVAADPMFTAAYSGVNSGLVIITADEPGQHSSQNEQDNRNYAKAAKLPMFEPANSDEAIRMVKAAYEISEEHQVPVIVRMTTRVCHSKSVAEISEPAEPKFTEYVKNAKRFICVPANAIPLRHAIEGREKALLSYSEQSEFNIAEYHDKKTGIICSGMCYFFAKEIFGDTVSYLKLGYTNPLPEKLIASFCGQVGEVYVIEENDPYIEDKVKALGISCHGKDVLPPYGEMMPEIIRKSIIGTDIPEIEYDKKDIVNRPPALCAGCPHRGIFYELGRRDAVISGDIGCYTLGFAPPYNAMDVNLCMGASISMGHGLKKAFDIQGKDKKVVSIIGDSTFFHSGITSLIEVLYNGSNTVNIILDNRITGMTGHQENPGSGRHADLSEAPEIDIETLVRALGAKNVRTIDPNDLTVVNDTLDWAFSLDEPSVIITRWPCALKKFSKEDKEQFPEAYRSRYRVNNEKCIGCRKCLGCGCPALSVDMTARKAAIDATCLGCSVCSQICPVGAIEKEVR